MHVQLKKRLEQLFHQLKQNRMVILCRCIKVCSLLVFSRYTKTYNKTYPSVGNDTKQDVQDAPPRKHLPRSYSMASSICSGFSSNMHIPGADHNHDNDHPVETEFSSFRVSTGMHSV